MPNVPSPRHGAIIASYGRNFLAELDSGALVRCITAGKKGGVVCGDRVLIRLSGGGEGIIVERLPRTSLLYRADAYREKILAANITQVIVVVAAAPSFYEELIHRCLAAVEGGGLKALIVLNKSDLVEPTARALKTLELFKQLGYPLLSLSANRDITPLRPYLNGETSVLVGQSGMGKTSIVNALVPDSAARTGEISLALDSGKHTTTHARLYHLDDASHLIDSPGLQEFGLKHLHEADIQRTFVEFRPFLGHCRFRNCRHLREPGCAVREAVAQGQIDPRRLAAYHRIIG
ncbi:MAG TPA: ribosome small subunit-dependent GTPase A [Betaproteobacteria bacterium]|nr:ribosome small subunit-dependent GTPase A [Betaproteobacteria bacterium]